ncbi:hypothetical protein B0I27_105188 [Arcticibacter pallidicorallinus]|uniref:NACHT domain-containing protein n=1 Tax=Arcticibacter pallidicorallinus TaxID=1259464 RepID=A0A2T0U486_9SPHI|nr:hypothetical protein [Arcticibacter pallidicorallinus]PRY52720.1 hypothetical protein B0I27_105188 [Arcticibacter pallidicorallinus]
MNESGLTWSKVDWQDFQKISLFLYHKQMGDLSAEEFLRQGHFQSGIDLLSFRQESGKHVCIQCKHTNLTFSKLKKIVPLFLSGEYGETSESFIITTSADLQKPEIQSWITRQKRELREKYAIAFDIWDRSRLEDALTSHYGLTEKYFGIAEAKAHCFQPALNLPELKPVPGFLTRHIQPVTETGDTEAWHFAEKERSVLTLTSLITGQSAQREICVIAEAYEGKSSLMRQTAWELSQLDLAIVPLLLDLKFCSVIPIGQLLSDHFESWMSVPAKDLVILIDGLDEVPAAQFNTVVGHIRDFARNHPAVRVAFSCRKMFYNYQNLNAELPGFQFYELLELHMRQIFDYLEEQLGDFNKAAAFYSKMNGLGIANLLGTPFYLHQLVKWFNDPTQEMPNNRIAIATRFVDESLSVSATRKLRSGLSFDKHKVKYRDALQKLAILLQIKGLNACQDELLQEVFPQEDIDLLTHSSILNIRNGQWSFINALFQEQLAALALLKIEATEVIELVTLGDKIRKISRKWIQTLATYLSLLPENHEDRQLMVALIEADNIELLALSEGSKFSPEFRLEVLQKIISRTHRHQARLVAIDESNLASFADNDDAVVDELLAVLLLDTTVIVKIVACRTLRYLLLSASQAERYANLAKKVLVDIDDPDLGRLLLEAIAHYKLGDEQFLNQLLKNPLLDASHEFRQGLYQYLSAHNLVDTHYNWILSGFQALYAHNKSISHFGSERKLLDIVLTTRESQHIRHLLKQVQCEPFQSFFRHDKDVTKAFYKSLAGVCAEIYHSDRTIIFPVVAYLIFTGRHHYDREPNEMVEFLEITQTHSLGLRIAMLSEKTDLQKYSFSGALRPVCFPDILYAIEERVLDREGFNICCNGFFYSQQRDAYEQLEKLGETVFGFVNEPNPTNIRYRKTQERKRKNDLLYMGSREAFRNGIIQLFQIAGSETINTPELYERFDEDNPRLNVNSVLLTSFIREQSSEKEASLYDCLNAIDNLEYFKIWRADQLRRNHIIEYYPDLVIQHIEKYYSEEITFFPFDTLSVNSSYNERYQSTQLLKIWRDYLFPTDEDILLKFIRVNTEGYGGMRFASDNKRKSVTNALLNHFDERKYLLKQRVLSNLQTGLTDIAIIGTHLEFCRELSIKEALPYILGFILNEQAELNDIDDYMKLYVSLGGPHSDLLPVFNKVTDLNGYLLMFMVKLLQETHPLAVIEKLLISLHSDETSPERKIEAARHLSQLGNQEGFSFLISKFEIGKIAPFEIQGNVKIWGVETEWALRQLKPLMSILLDAKTDNIRFHHSPKDLLLEIFNGFAAKSEKDLQLVTGLMYQCAKELATSYPKNSGHLGWHAEQMTERYREINVVPLSTKEIKKLFEQISN